MPTSRWPRPGYPLLSASFREAWHDVVLPTDVLADSGMEGTVTLGMLADTIWDRLDLDTVTPIARHLRNLVQAQVVHRPDSDLAQQPIITLPWHPDLDPTTLPISPRTRNVLERLGKTDDADWMSTVTAAEFTAPHFPGAGTLLDFATVIEAHLVGNVDGVLVSRQEVIAHINGLRRSYPMDRIPASDPRFGFTGQSVSLAEVLEGRGAAGSLPVFEAWGTVHRVRETLDRIAHQAPEEALLELAEALLDGNPNTHAVVRRLGWDGHGGCTLTEAAAMAGVSWQRIGQLEAKLLGAVREGSWWYMPGGVERYLGETD